MTETAHRDDLDPAPAGTFNLCARLSYPKPEVLDGTWTLPAVQKAG